eukprot:1329483-Amorphochlora_amoeboformis.AAC.1
MGKRSGLYLVDRALIPRVSKYVKDYKQKSSDPSKVYIDIEAMIEVIRPSPLSFTRKRPNVLGYVFCFPFLVSVGDPERKRKLERERARMKRCEKTVVVEEREIGMGLSSRVVKKWYICAIEAVNTWCGAFIL